MSKLHVLEVGDEQKLVARLRAGDAEAFQALHHRYLGRVLGLARQMLRAQEAAEDAAQETFLRVFRNFHRFRGDAALTTWIHRIAVNVCFDEIARAKRKTARAETLAEPDLASPVAAAEDREMAVQLDTLLRAMEPRKRAAFYLHHIEGFSAGEVADVMGETRDAVLKRLQRTRAELLTQWQKRKTQDDSDASAL